MSGVDIPSEVFEHLVDGQTPKATSVLPLYDLTVALRAAMSTQTNTAGYTDMCCELLRQTTSMLSQDSRPVASTQDESDALRHGLLLVLKAYGVSDDDISQSSIAMDMTAAPRVAVGYVKHGG